MVDDPGRTVDSAVVSAGPTSGVVSPHPGNLAVFRKMLVETLHECESGKIKLRQGEFRSPP